VSKCVFRLIIAANWDKGEKRFVQASERAREQERERERDRDRDQDG